MPGASIWVNWFGCPMSSDPDTVHIQVGLSIKDAKELAYRLRVMNYASGSEVLRRRLKVVGTSIGADIMVKAIHEALADAHPAQVKVGDYVRWIKAPKLSPSMSWWLHSMEVIAVRRYDAYLIDAEGDPRRLPLDQLRVEG